MELRYVKNGLQWMPERKDKNGNWVSFKKDYLQNFEEVFNLATAIAKLRNSSGFYSNTQELYFHDEMSVMAFLGGCQSFFGKETKVFEIFVEEPEKS